MTRGVYLIVPRNMTQACGFYNTMIESDDSAIVIECLKKYETKEEMPKNIEKIKIPIGSPEILKNGNDITIVTYGYMCDIIIESSKLLESINISCEIIDVQTILPFDINQKILKSIKKTKKVIFIDEDVPGGTTAYMMQKIIEEQKSYNYLEINPTTLTSKPHRPAYSNDGEYFSKPNTELIFEKIYNIMSESNPKKFNSIY
jgi:pyruvate/2-oxoglutarate/acetoin dehydrogenase E1 component